MRLAILAAIAFFVGILIFAWVGSERAHPQMIDVDPAAMQQHKHP